MGVRYSIKQSIFALGPHQTNFQNEATLAVNTYRQIIKEGYDKAKFSSPNIPNEGYSTGFALANKTSKGNDSTSFSAREDLTIQRLGMLLYDFMGVAATPTVVVASEVWRHRFSLLDIFVGNTLPCRPLFSKIGNPALIGNNIHNAKLPSMTGSQFTLTNANEAPLLTAQTEYLGSGKYVEPSGLIYYGAGKHVLSGTELDGEVDMPNKLGTATIYPEPNFGGTPIATVCLISDINLALNNNLIPEIGYECNLFQDDDTSKGAIMGELPSGGQTVDFGFTAIADSDVINNFGLTERIKTGAPFSFKWDLTTTSEIGSTGEYHGAIIEVAKAAVKDDSDWVDVNSQQGFRIEAELLGEGNTMPLEVELTTDVADFATYIAPA